MSDLVALSLNFMVNDYQVPQDNIDEFKSVKKFKVFNTNNLWVRLDAIEELLPNKFANFEVIANRKV